VGPRLPAPATVSLLFATIVDETRAYTEATKQTRAGHDPAYARALDAAASVQRPGDSGTKRELASAADDRPRGSAGVGATGLCTTRRPSSRQAVRRTRREAEDDPLRRRGLKKKRGAVLRGHGSDERRSMRPGPA
jgi:hypothetical protein